MTILANELRINQSIRNVTLIQVADRRITRGGKFDSNRRKVFEIPYLKASVGYFGLAQPTSREYFSSWLPNVIRHGHGIKTVKEFSEYLTDQLNKNVTKSLLETNPSGFHLCGLAEDGIPEFYFIRNIDRMEGPYYKGFKDAYSCSEGFRTRDAITTNDGKKRPLSSLQNCIFWYVNGDLRSFWAFWMPATQFIDSISMDPEFPALKSDLERAKWKLKVIAQLYEKYAKQKIVGGPIDGIEIKP
jgi:hypothetical protein